MAASEGRLAAAEARLVALESDLAHARAMREAVTVDSVPTALEEAMRVHLHGMSQDTKRTARRAVLHHYATATGDEDARISAAVAYLQHGEVKAVESYLQS